MNKEIYLQEISTNSYLNEDQLATLSFLKSSQRPGFELVGSKPQIVWHLEAPSGLRKLATPDAPPRDVSTLISSSANKLVASNQISIVGELQPSSNSYC